MSESAQVRKGPSWAVLAWLIAGLALLVAAWSLPVNLKSVSPALLSAAGEGTPSVAAFGRDLADFEKLGPAELVLETARAVGDPRTPALADAINRLAARQPELVAWGGWDPFLDPLFNLRESKGRASSTPVMTFLLPEKARETLRAYLANSRSGGVQSLLKTRELTVTGRFVPATQPGGQPLDAVILLSALLYQGGHLSAPLQRELHALAEAADAQKALGELEAFDLDLLSLSQRLDWIQLCELLSRTEGTKTVGEYAHLARVAPDQLPLIYTAALFSDSADRVANYLIQYGKAGAEDLRLALTDGQGSVRLLLLRQVPVSRLPGPGFGAAATFGLLHPRIALVAKWLGFLVGAFCLLRGLDRSLFVSVPGAGPALPHLQSGVLALLVAGLLVLVTEPFLLRAAPASEYKLRLVLPVLASATELPAAPSTKPSPTMETSTLLSIGLFAVLQVSMYLLCLVKIREVAHSAVPPLVKLKLMENEENLFDGGLYIGIAGTATALVLQVLRIIPGDLLAAYSSNLFGIICVALVKIRHVRPYKRSLILASQATTAPAAVMTA
ncbi:MAG TPA: hypothetical protein VG838_11115 [Opitutaceae bacterium]|nr:hypothetical protein [Opitutaceae bacterium]